MMHHDLDSIALASQDGVVTGMSDHEETHPLYGTPAHSLRMTASLDQLERESADNLLWTTDVSKTIRHSIRSWAAQLGLAGFNPECTEVRLRGSTVDVETLVSDISGKEDGMLIDSLRRNVSSGKARLSRILLLPPDSLEGLKRLPLQTDRHYDFDRRDLSPETIDGIWQGASGRQAILDIRKNMGMVPDTLLPGRYFVGAVEANPNEHCWVIEPELMRGENRVRVLHDQSCLYDPVRTQGERQVEIRNINGIAESLKDLDVLVSVYRTNLELFHCDHQRGV